MKTITKLFQKKKKEYFDEKRTKKGNKILSDKKNKNKFTFIGSNCRIDQISVVKRSIKKSKYYFEVDLILDGCNNSI
jgi:hypothetical protein